MFSFQVLQADGKARLGRLVTAHGEVATPVFMPVGTCGSVKGVTPDQLAAAGVQMVLANAYHLMLRPGADVVAELGGLHRLMAWPGPILTDSGGYQVFSLAHLRTLDDDGVTFRSHVDGTKVALTPESCMDIQRLLGADIVMQLDECPPADASREQVAVAVRRSAVWAERCKIAWRKSVANPPFDSAHGPEPVEGQSEIGVSGPRVQETKPAHPTTRCSSIINRKSKIENPNARSLTVAAHQDESAIRNPQSAIPQALFGIQQGGVHADLRAESAARLVELDLPGYAVGGLSVGEPHEAMCGVLEAIDSQFPPDRPRYLMGVGEPRDILAAVARGVDMFDCVLPTRNGRNAQAFTWAGRVRLRNARWRQAPAPLDERCGCYTCRNFSRGALRHLFAAGEMLAATLVSIHNLHFFAEFLSAVRDAIGRGELHARTTEWIAAMYP